MTDDLYDREFVRRWVNWEETLQAIGDGRLEMGDANVQSLISNRQSLQFDDFDRVLKSLYAEFTFQRAAAEAQVESLRAHREARDAAQVAIALRALREAAEGDANILPASIEAARAGVTTGEIGRASGRERV